MHIQNISTGKSLHVSSQKQLIPVLSVILLVMRIVITNIHLMLLIGQSPPKHSYTPLLANGHNGQLMTASSVPGLTEV